MITKLRNFSKSKKGNVLLGTAVQLLSVLALFVKQIALIPVYLKYIDPATYGTWIAIQSVGGLFYIFNPGFSDYFRQRLAKAYGASDQCKIRLEYSRLIFFQFALSFLIGGAGLCAWFFGGIPWLLGKPNLSASLDCSYLLMLIGVVLVLLSQAYAVLNMALMRAPLVAVVALFANIVSVLVIYLSVKATGVVSIPLGAVGFSLIILCGNMWIANSLRKKVNAVYIDWRVGLRFYQVSGLGYTFGARISRILLTSLDSIILFRFFGESTVIVYDIVKKLMSFGSVVMDKIANQLVAPIASKVAEVGHASYRRLELRLLISGYSGPAVFFVLATLLSKYVITHWVGVEYYHSLLFSMLVSLYLTGIMCARWGMNLVFSRGDFKATFIGNLLLLVFVNSGRCIGGFYGDVDMYVCLQALPVVVLICAFPFFMFRQNQAN